ncbi:MAG: tetratricopeptide repeat protein [Gammaproteobacteria bacterium]|nr:tetratricopeptide repeat protein [Gammaproteobacteria bacterium]
MAFQQGQYERVEKLSNDPMLTGSAYYRQKKYAEANKAFSQKTTARLLYNRGNALARQGQLPQALIAYRQAIELDPTFSDAQFNHDLIDRFITKNPEADATSGEADNGSAESEEQQEALSAETRAGQVSQITNLGDQSKQAGVGASPGSTRGQADEKVGEVEIQLEQFLKQLQQENFRLDPESVKLWTDNLYADPSELFKRKFLRDHLRNKRQQR